MPSRPAPAHGDDTARMEQLFLDHLEQIEGVIRHICRRHRLAAAEADDFRSAALLKLVDHDYAVLRQFQQRARLTTYLTIVLQRVFLDMRVSAWGKWRPSAEAKREGAVAILLERCLVRDGLPFEEAVETMRTAHGVEEPREVLAGIAARLPVRVRKRPSGEEALADLPADDPGPDEDYARDELRAPAAQVSAALADAIGSLEPRDRLIVRLRFYDGMSVADIARMLALEAKPLYRRIDQLVAGLRRQLEAAGVTADTAGALRGVLWSDLVEPDR